MIRVRVAGAVAAALVATGVGACGSTSTSAGARSTTSSTLAPDVVNIKQPVTLTIEIDGFHTIRFDDQSNFNVLRANGSQGVRLLTAGTFAGARAGEWTIHEAFVNLVHFTGDGTYAVKARRKGTGTQQMVDNAYVTLSRATATSPTADAGRFDVLLQPCRAVIERKGVDGSLRCPALADDQGNVISLTMRWKGNGPAVDLLAQVASTTVTSTTSASSTTASSTTATP